MTFIRFYMKYFLLQAFILASLFAKAIAAHDSTQIIPSTNAISYSHLAADAVKEYERLEANNKVNDLIGQSYLNDYIIELDTKNWIEERGESKILKYNLKLLNDALFSFNMKRPDKLRLYVVVVNDYVATLNSEVKLESLSKWEKLSKLESAVYNEEESFQELKNDLSAIPIAISKAMIAEGYEERAIYLCSQVEIFSLSESSSKKYLMDALYLQGDRLKKKQQDIRYRVRTGVSKANQFDFSERIQSAVFNIMTSIEMVIDKGLGEDDRDPRCKMVSLEQAIANTTLTREANVDVDRFSAFIKNQQVNQVTKYVMVDDFKNFSKIGESIFFKEIIPDKVKMLNTGFSDYNLYVVYKEIQYAMPATDWVKFAKDVHTTAHLNDNTIVIAVPYYKMGCQYLNGFGGTTEEADLLLMPAAWCPSADAGMMSAMNSIFSTLSQNTQDSYVLKRWEGVFNQAFSKIPKDYLTFNYDVTWNGDIISYKSVKREALTGLEDLVAVNIRIDERFYKYAKVYLNDCILPKKADLISEWNALLTEIFSQTSDSKEKQEFKLQEFLLSAVADSKCRPEFAKNVAVILEKKSEFKPFKMKSNLVQSKIDLNLATDYVKWIVSRELADDAHINVEAPDDSKFYGGINKVRVKDVLEIFDKVSMALSFIQLDFIADSFSAYYATVNEEYGDAAMAYASLALPISAGVLKATLSGEKMFLKTLGDEFVSVPIDLIKAIKRGGKAAAAVGDITIAMMHNPNALQNVFKYKEDRNFLLFFEDEILKADKQVLDALNNSPDLIDEFYHFQMWNDGKGLSDFFVERKLLEGLPPPAMKPFKEAPGISLAALGNDRGILQAVGRIKHEPGWFDVIVHGKADGSSFQVLHNGLWVDLDHRQLYVWLRKQPGFLEAMSKGNGIRVLSCRGTKKELVENLGRKARAKTKGVNVNIQIERDGSVAAAPGEIGGHWSEFDHNGWSINFEKQASGVHEANKISVGTSDNGAVSLGFFDDGLDGLNNAAKVFVDRFLNKKSDDLIKQTVLKKKSDKKFIDEVFVLKSESEGLIRASKRDYDARFKNTKVDRSSLPEYAKYKDVIYFNEVEKLRYEAKIKKGQWYVDGKLLGEDNIYIFVMDKNGNIYIGEGIQGKVHHTSFVNGGDVVLAGTMDFKNGQLANMDNISGHYLPGGDDLEIGVGEFLREMGHRGVAIEGIKYTKVTDDAVTVVKGIPKILKDPVDLLGPLKRELDNVSINGNKVLTTTSSADRLAVTVFGSNEKASVKSVISSSDKNVTYIVETNNFIDLRDPPAGVRVKTPDKILLPEAEIKLPGKISSKQPLAVVEVIDDQGRITYHLGNCFPASVSVHTPSGLKLIKNLKVGEEVLCRNEVTGEVITSYVSKTFVRSTTHLSILYSQGQELIQSTSDHPFWVLEREDYIKAKDIKAGSHVYTLAGKQNQLASISPWRGHINMVIDSVVRKDTLLTVYNLEVAEYHNYFVNPEGILVHNAQNYDDVINNLKDLLKDALDDFYSRRPNKYVKEVLDDLVASNNRASIEKILGVKKPDPAKLLGTTGENYIAPFHNVYDGEIDGVYDKMKKIKYFKTEAERLPYEVMVKNGKLYQNGVELPVGKYDFVLAQNGKIYAGVGVDGVIHHSSYVAGENVAMAGSITVDASRNIRINNHSGHYKPQEPATSIGIASIVEELTSRGVDIYSLEILIEKF
jgi:Pretoxin HINT domain